MKQPTTRQLKVGKQIQKDIADILQKEGREYLGSAFVSVSHVYVSPDFSIARVYLSFLGNPNKGEILANINDNVSVLRRALGGRIRHQLRKVPELVFFEDETLDEIEKMEELFKKIEKPNDEESES